MPLLKVEDDGGARTKGVGRLGAEETGQLSDGGHMSYNEEAFSRKGLNDGLHRKGIARGREVDELERFNRCFEGRLDEICRFLCA